ncbi:MAG: site-specific DNA-methyltransferase, partial [Chloroflexi bacterium]|nr:site-specific DNA-methyltransferase [Chloroflexota bacterium]
MSLPTPYYSDEMTTLYLGDCRELLPAVDPVSLVLTDPPYGITYVSNSGAGRGTTPISNDGTRLSLRLYREVVPVMRADHILWFTRWDAWPDVWYILGAHHPLRGLLVWDKGSPGMGDLEHWGPSYELIASAGNGRITGGRDGSVLRYNAPPSRDRLHPTQKPVSLLSYLIGKLDPTSVLDPFAGSGSTLVAAKSLGRRSIGIEIEERYAEIA